jgi:hypothetical protein
MTLGVLKQRNFLRPICRPHCARQGETLGSLSTATPEPNKAPLLQVGVANRVGVPVPKAKT